jgi:hypothetical protein
MPEETGQKIKEEKHELIIIITVDHQLKKAHWCGW